MPALDTCEVFASELAAFRDFGKQTIVKETVAADSKGHEVSVPVYVNEFWTSRQRKAHSLHEISYRACFKPQLPRFFIVRLTREGEKVYDPFMGRGTTPLEAALLGRKPMGNDVNPLSVALLRPRLGPPSLQEIQHRLDALTLDKCSEYADDLLVFYHPDTLREICALREYFLERESDSEMDRVDEWIRMVAVNRLTGHSSGFFSVYSLPPNQAVSIKSQERINTQRNQVPPRRDVKKLILKKSKSLLRDYDEEIAMRLKSVSRSAMLFTGPADHTPGIDSNSVALVVTSPPFLDVVQYKVDNWLRCWFCGIDPDSVPISACTNLDAWERAMTSVFRELERVLKRDGLIAFEVGEVKKGRVLLEESVLMCALDAGLSPVLVLVNDQKFTKTSHCWGVQNLKKGTNTNRVVLLQKP